jgi:dTDP-4-amino-4,6-dideoxygalactose transaminase
MIKFNVPYVPNSSLKYFKDVIKSSHFSGNGKYTKLCQTFFEKRYDFPKCLLTTSCTDALEMAAILLNIQIGDEVIIPSYTFVSTANAFVLRGAKLIFLDSRSDHPGLDEKSIESLITKRTKAIVVVHYAGVACDMIMIMAVARKYNLYVVEDAAHSIDSFYNNIPLGSFGHLSTFSFHETKNVQCGEGGMLVINDLNFVDRAEIILEKGTNRVRFFRSEIDKYSWVDIGSSFLPSEFTSSVLFSQLEHLDKIQRKRRILWDLYFNELGSISSVDFTLPFLPSYSSNNAHLFYIICKSKSVRDELIFFLKSNNIQAVFHYSSLHNSEFYKDKYEGLDLLNSDKFSYTLVRLPLYYSLRIDQALLVCKLVRDFFNVK